MQVSVWHSPEIKPHDNAKIRFKLKDDDAIYEGLYIEQEDMFYVGFENESEHFHFTWKVEKWSFMEEPTFDLIKLKKEPSAVEFLEDKLMNHPYGGVYFPNNPKQLFEQAKAMEKEQKIKFAFDFYYDFSNKLGVPFNLISENRLNAEQYYNETFKSE